MRERYSDSRASFCRFSTSITTTLERLLESRGGAEGGARAAGRRRRPVARTASTSGCCSKNPRCARESTFTIGVRELGGDIIETPADVVLGGREPINDVARNLERWVYAAVDPHVRAGPAAANSPTPRRACTSSMR